MNKVLTLGEIMLRLKSPGFERLLQSPFLEATFGGGEANVAVSLANFGADICFITVLPKNAVGDACISYLRARGVDTSKILRAGERMGIYFIEAGANQRPSQVVYDRINSSIATTSYEQFDWNDVFSGVSWFHITGITPALSQTAADLSLHAVKQAKLRGLTVSCDYNFRKNLWRYGKTAQAIMTELVSFIDVGIANEEDCQKTLGIMVEDGGLTDITADKVNPQKYQQLTQIVFEKFPNLKMQAITLRESYNANHNGWSGCVRDREGFYLSRHYDIPDIVDRIGSGDAFAAGTIYGLISGFTTAETLEFSVAASCLKHSIPGDSNLVSVDEVKKLIEGNSTGRIQR